MSDQWWGDDPDPEHQAWLRSIGALEMNEQEITKTHFSENWAVEQVARFAARGVDGWTFVPHILLQLPAQHRRSAVNALRIAHTLLLIEMRPSANINPHVSADDLAMCPQDSTGEPLAWARLKVP